MTPLLILLFGVHPLTAVGSDLLYAAVTKSAGTAIHSKNGNVDWRGAGLLAAGSVPTTVLTIWVLSQMPKESPTTAVIISMTLPWRHKNLALPVTQFTGPDAPRSPNHAQAKSANGRQRECPKMYLTSEIVKDTLAARRFRLLAPLAVLLALAALTLAPGIVGIR